MVCTGTRPGAIVTVRLLVGYPTTVIVIGPNQVKPRPKPKPVPILQSPKPKPAISMPQ